MRAGPVLHIVLGSHSDMFSSANMSCIVMDPHVALSGSTSLDFTMASGDRAGLSRHASFISFHNAQTVSLLVLSHHILAHCSGFCCRWATWWWASCSPTLCAPCAVVASRPRCLQLTCVTWQQADLWLSSPSCTAWCSVRWGCVCLHLFGVSNFYLPGKYRQGEEKL